MHSSCYYTLAGHMVSYASTGPKGEWVGFRLLHANGSQLAQFHLRRVGKSGNHVVMRWTEPAPRDRDKYAVVFLPEYATGLLQTWCDHAARLVVGTGKSGGHTTTQNLQKVGQEHIHQQGDIFKAWVVRAEHKTRSTHY